MSYKAMILLVAAGFLAACEPERGSGFTGIGTQSAVDGYATGVAGISAD